MLEKYLDISEIQPDGTPGVQIIDGSHLTSFVKTASFNTLTDDVKEFIAKIEPMENRAFLLCSAVTDGSAWDDNKNHDWFPTRSLANLSYDGLIGLDYGAYTFMKGHLFFDHKNKDPKKSFGSVVFSIYNPIMRRIELVIRANIDKDERLRNAISNGDYMALSMGCRVPFDVCPVEMPNWEKLYDMPYKDIKKKAESGELQHINFTQAQYSRELKTSLGEILPNGNKYMLINLFPQFFDISWITNARHADPAAIVLSKVASEQNKEGDKQMDGIKNSKNAEISKEIDGEVMTSGRNSLIDYYHNKLFPVLEMTEKNLPADKLDDVAKFPLKDILSTFMGAGMKIHPEEFQRIILIQMGKKDIADEMDASKEVFDYITPNHIPKYDQMVKGCFSPNNINEELLNMLSPFFNNRSYETPHIQKRIIIIKKAMDNGQPVIGGESHRLGGMYAAIGGILGALWYSAKKHGNAEASNFINSLAKNPKKIMLLAAVPLLLNAITRTRENSPYNRQKYPIYKVGAFRVPLSAKILGPLAGTYLWSGHILNKAREGRPLTTIEATVLKHPMGVSLAGMGLAINPIRKGVFNTIGSIFKSSADHGGILEKIGIENMDVDDYYPIVADKLLADYAKSSGIDKVAIIKPVGDKFYLYSHDGKVLGKHDTREQAEKQEIAINISKAKNK